MTLKDLIEKVGPWLDSFSARTMREESEQLRTRFVVAVLLLILVYCVSLAASSAFLPIRPEGRSLLIEFCVITLFGCALALAILRVSGSQAVCLHIFILTLLAALINIAMELGGIYSPSMPAMLLIPALATSILGFRAGIFWAIVLLLFLATLHKAEQAGLHFPNIMLEENRSFGTALGLGSAVIVTTLIILFYEFTTQKLNQQLRTAHDDYLFQANHDPLTGLANRRYFSRIIATFIERCDQGGEKFAILFFDLNRFKEANDSFGHHFGDEILVKIAQRLRQQSRQTDYVARWGGDEFAMLLPGVSTESSARLRITDLLAKLEKNLSIEGEDISISASIGYALYPKHGTDYETLIHHADHTMYAQKRESQADYLKSYNTEH